MPNRKNARWADDDDARLLRLRVAGFHTRQIAQLLGRSETAVLLRLAFLRRTDHTGAMPRPANVRTDQYQPRAQQAMQSGEPSAAPGSSWVADLGFARPPARPIIVRRQS